MNVDSQSTIERLQEALNEMSEVAFLHFEILKAHHPEGPHDCPICAAEVPGVMARLSQAMASMEALGRSA